MARGLPIIVVVWQNVLGKPGRRSVEDYEARLAIGAKVEQEANPPMQKGLRQ